MAKARRTSARKSGAKSGGMKRASKDEQARIEELLGEDFETLSEARAALAKETGAVPGKSSYKVRELSNKNTVAKFVDDLEKRADEIDALKKPEEYFAAEIYGHKTWTVFGSSEQLARKLGTYKGLREEHPKKSLQQIKIIRIKGRNGLAEWQRQKRLEVEKSLKASHKSKRERTRMKKRIKSLEAQIKALKTKRH